MKLVSALQLGYGCGMKTVDDCLYNVHLHAMNLFPYDEMAAEESELATEFTASGIDKDMPVKEALLKLHTDKSVCPFCGSELKPGFYENVPAWVCSNNDCDGDYADFDISTEEYK